LASSAVFDEMTGSLCAVFLLSGAAALVFETLWFRQAGLAFGNGVWASSIVLASFMTGLALGNGLAARLGARIRRPVRFYVLLEVIIGAVGCALVWLLPGLSGGLARVLGPMLEQPWLLNPLRLLFAFLLLVIPATAMGTTLPILVKALRAWDPSFGSALGRLYGWNTLGAVVGAVAGDAVLIEWLGVRGTALAAAGGNLTAALAAFLIARRFETAASEATHARREPAPISKRGWQCLAAAMLSGGIFLALEVVWFRFLHLFVHSGSLVFSMMLAVVLAGIALGGLLAGSWLRRRQAAFRHASSIALLGGLCTVATYAGFQLSLESIAAGSAHRVSAVLPLAASLMLPVSLLSGILFPLIGAALHQESWSETRSAGLLTLANTMGGALGALTAGFLLLPLLGMERSFFLLAALYGLIAVLLGARATAASSTAVLRFAPAALFAAALLLFPFGAMEGRYLEHRVRRFPDDTVVAVREGRTETIIYLRSDFLGEPLSYRLLTDGFNMSATVVAGRRYMKLFVYLPVALRPQPRRALLISYGVGSTAKALVDTSSLEQIDVVDISREILEMNELVFPDPAEHPLRDPRVRVHVDDGRYFLLTSRERYDLITGEPPPPKNAGVVNLYTREYFQLIYDRLAEGGVASYWLPVHNLYPSDAKAIIRAFCETFSDCSLWVGNALDWTLVGSRGGKWSRAEPDFARQWEDPAVISELRAVGVELPEQLGALFIGDASYLRELTRDTEPLVDDFPKRLSNRSLGNKRYLRAYHSWMDPSLTRRRFEASDFIRAAWPEALRERTLPYFEYQGQVNRFGLVSRRLQRMPWESVGDLHAVLTRTPLRTLALWHLGTGVDELRIVERVGDRLPRSAPILSQLGLRALADRDFNRASEVLGRAAAANPGLPVLHYFRLYALCMAGRAEEAERLTGQASQWRASEGSDRQYWRWMRRTFGLAAPYRGSPQ
jgi:predicted membrane-bound spermidine synthase